MLRDQSKDKKINAVSLIKIIYRLTINSVEYKAIKKDVCYTNLMMSIPVLIRIIKKRGRMSSLISVHDQLHWN